MTIVGKKNNLQMQLIKYHSVPLIFANDPTERERLKFYDIKSSDKLF